MDFTVRTYKQSKGDKTSLYVLSNNEIDVNDAIEFAEASTSMQIELIEEQEKSVASCYGFKNCVVFHEC